AGGLGDKGGGLPPFHREAFRCVEGMAGARRVFVVLVDLTNVGRAGIKDGIVVCPRSAGSSASDRRVGVLGMRHIERRVSVGGGAHDVEVGGGSEAPGIVGGGL